MACNYALSLSSHYFINIIIIVPPHSFSSPHLICLRWLVLWRWRSDRSEPLILISDGRMRIIIWQSVVVRGSGSRAGPFRKSAGMSTHLSTDGLNYLIMMESRQRRWQTGRVRSKNPDPLSHTGSKMWGPHDANRSS